MIKTARFTASYGKASALPSASDPEFAFIGRSNVGKSSLINMLCNHKGLAKTSQTPGKTQTINFFRINDEWNLVDLPGYGYARTSKSKREEFRKLIESYLLSRQQLVCVMVLIDSRHEPQEADINFINWLGEAEIPFVIVFTKIDKLKPAEVERCTRSWSLVLDEHGWQPLPDMFLSSSEKKTGKEELLDFMNKVLKSLSAKS